MKNLILLLSLLIGTHSFADAMNGPGVGVESVNANQIHSLPYPNPANGVVHLDLKNNFKSNDLQVSVIDLQGRTLIHTYMRSETTLNVDISSLTAGVYLLNVQLKGDACRENCGEHFRFVKM